MTSIFEEAVMCLLPCVCVCQEGSGLCVGLKCQNEKTKGVLEVDMEQGPASGCPAGQHKGKGKGECWGLGSASSSGQDKGKGKGKQVGIHICNTPLGQLLTDGCSPEEWETAMEQQQLAQVHLCLGHPELAAYKNLLTHVPVQPDVNIFGIFD